MLSPIRYEWNKKEKEENRNLSKNANVTKEKHSSQALVSSIIHLSRSLASCGPLSRNERQPALSQGFRGFAQITKPHINLNSNLSNLLSFYPAGTSTLDVSGGQTNSAGEHLRTVLQITEPRSNNSTASQPSGI